VDAVRYAPRGTRGFFNTAERVRYEPPTVEQVMEGLIQAHGTKARSRFHVTGGVKPIVSTLPPLIAAQQLSNEPQTLLLIPRRDDSGKIRPAWVRAGAVVYVEEA
jgi:hypothetical protein